MKRFSNILLVSDADSDSSTALKRALALAVNNQASLTLVNTVDYIPRGMREVTDFTPEELIDFAVSEKREQLDKALKVAVKEGVEIKSNVLVGKRFLEIIRQVLQNKHDLVIKCAESTSNPRDILFGSTDMHLMRKCPCPIWIIKPSGRDHCRRILAAVDQELDDTHIDELNRPILEIATSLALSESSELHVVHAWTLIGESRYRSRRLGMSEVEVDAMVLREASRRKRWLTDLVNTFGTKTDKDAIDYLNPELHTIEGYAGNIVPKAAQDLDVDLIIMGTVARTGIPGFFMGNTAENILDEIDCSVLAIKPPGFKSPVSL